MKDRTTALAPEDIRALRQRLGLTQAEFARRLGVATITVHTWESGRRRPGRLHTITQLLRLQANPHE